MHIPTLISHKRDGGTLDLCEITHLVNAYAKGSLPGYQMAAFAMAVFFRSMSLTETAAHSPAPRRNPDSVDFAVGFYQLAKTNQPIHSGQSVARIHARSQADFDMAEALLLLAIHITT